MFTKFKTMENLVKQFEENQTIENLDKVLDSGVTLKKLEGGKWVEGTKDITLPIRFIRLYDKVKDHMVLSGIGIY